MEDRLRDLEKERVEILKRGEGLLTEEQKGYLRLVKPLTEPEQLEILVHVSTEGTTYADKE
jgi:hypothetical protein